jgi:ATP-dependent DNA helicase RecG
MDALTVKEMLHRGEDSRTQFKENIYNTEQLSAEMIAFSNSMGGIIVLGVTDNCEAKGLSDDDIRRLNQLISNTANENVKPPIFPKTEIVTVDDKKLLLVHIPFGNNKPYRTNKGIYYTKSGSDKRKMSQDELRRLFQESGKLYADEMVFKNAKFNDIDLDLFQQFHEKKYDLAFEGGYEQLPQTFENLNLASDGYLNLAGILMFCNNPMKYTPLSQVIAVSFVGNDMSVSEYRDSENIEGNFKTLFTGALTFMKRNLKKIQKDPDFNSKGVLEIPSLVLEELLINAMIHRDYFISSNIRILIFDNRIEIVSPGKLPNNLTIEKITRGISVRRNHTLSSLAFDLLPYRGIGSGILRVLNLYPEIEFVNDTEIEQFKAIIKRPTQIINKT